MGLPYHLLFVIAAVALAVRYVILTDASGHSKCIVGGAVAVSLLISWYLPQWYLPATLLQLSVSIYVLFYLKATSDAP
jgi:hypothetical protein